jgi:hypothetical protein
MLMPDCTKTDRQMSLNRSVVPWSAAAGGNPGFAMIENAPLALEPGAMCDTGSFAR